LKKGLSNYADIIIPMVYFYILSVISFFPNIASSLIYLSSPPLALLSEILNLRYQWLFIILAVFSITSLYFYLVSKSFYSKIFSCFLSLYLLYPLIYFATSELFEQANLEPNNYQVLGYLVMSLILGLIVIPIGIFKNKGNNAV